MFRYMSVMDFEVIGEIQSGGSPVLRPYVEKSAMNPFIRK